jgi:serine/threonine-protein kinase
VNPPEATRCNCGYDFSTKTHKSPYFHQKLPPEIKQATSDKKHIKYAWIAAVVSGSLTLLFVLIAIGGSPLFPGFGAANLLDVALLYGFAFGVYRHSRVCAILLASYGVFNAFYMASQTGFSIIQFVLLYFYCRAVPATFTYHKLERSKII